jgi:hypothetical protein
MSSRRSFRGVPCPGAFLWSMPTAHGVISNSGLFCLTVSVARPAPQSHLRSKPVRAPVRSTRVALIDMRVPVPCSRWSSRCVTGPQSNRDWRSGRAANCRKPMDRHGARQIDDGHAPRLACSDKDNARGRRLAPNSLFFQREANNPP